MMSTNHFNITRDNMIDVLVDVTAVDDTPGCYSLSIEGESQGKVCFHTEDKYQWKFDEEKLSYREQNQVVTHIQQLIG